MLSLPPAQTKPANPRSTNTPHPPQSSPENGHKSASTGRRVVTSKRVDVWHGFQLVKCHYPERWATLSSSTPGFPPAPSLLGCWHGSQPPSWHRSFVLAWLRKGFWWHPDSARWVRLLWPPHSPLRQDWLCQMASPGSPAELWGRGATELQGEVGRQAESELGDVQRGSGGQEEAC